MVPELTILEMLKVKLELQKVIIQQLTVTELPVALKARKEMARALLRKELYGQNMGKFAQSPEWDDVEPIPQDESDNELATIA